jgi:hypothetical protein
MIVLEPQIIHWAGFAVHSLDIHLGDLSIVPHHVQRAVA